MKRKNISLFLVIISFMMLSACSRPKLPFSFFNNHNDSSSSSKEVTAKKSQNNEKYIDFGRLGSERSEVTFLFRGRDSYDGGMGAANIDLKITNNTDKYIILNPTKIYVGDSTGTMDGQSPVSKYTREIRLKPKQTVTKKSFFANANGQMFLDTGFYAYASSNNKLAYVFGTFNEGASTDNLSNEELIEKNDHSNNEE